MQSRGTPQSELLAPGAEALVVIQPELICLLRLHGMCRVDEVFKASYWAPGAEALVLI